MTPKTLRKNKENLQDDHEDAENTHKAFQNNHNDVQNDHKDTENNYKLKITIQTLKTPTNRPQRRSKKLHSRSN